VEEDAPGGVKKASRGRGVREGGAGRGSIGEELHGAKETNCTDCGELGRANVRRRANIRVTEREGRVTGRTYATGLVHRARRRLAGERSPLAAISKVMEGGRVRSRVCAGLQLMLCSYAEV
jgi:hypothetical protein